MSYKIGQCLVCTEDIELSDYNNDIRLVPKGDTFIVGADNFLHHTNSGIILKNRKGIEGYDVKNIAKYLYSYINRHYKLDSMLSSEDIEKDKFIEKIELALDEIGF